MSGGEIAQEACNENEKPDDAGGHVSGIIVRHDAAGTSAQDSVALTVR
jgi:hypothetical protein